MYPAAAPKICSEWRNTILAQKNIFAFAPGYADLEGGPRRRGYSVSFGDGLSIDMCIWMVSIFGNEGSSDGVPLL